MNPETWMLEHSNEHPGDATCLAIAAMVAIGAREDDEATFDEFLEIAEEIINDAELTMDCREPCENALLPKAWMTNHREEYDLTTSLALAAMEQYAADDSEFDEFFALAEEVFDESQ